MDPADEQESERSGEAGRDERLERIRRLVGTRDQDAASLVKTWLHRSQEKAGRKRRG